MNTPRYPAPALNDLPDDLITKVSILYYTDAREALLADNLIGSDGVSYGVAGQRTVESFSDALRYELRPFGIDPQGKGGAATVSQRSRLSNASRCHRPGVCPIGHTMPKLRTDAPVARVPRSNTTTRSPRRANA